MICCLTLPRFAASLAAAAALTVSAAAAQTAAPAPHRAAYELTEDIPVQGEGLLLRGVEAFEWTEECDGATLFQRNALIAGEGAEPAFQSESQLSAWEARDGSRMRFFYEQQSNTAGTEQVSGMAERQADGSIAVHYKGAEGGPKILPAETLLPWQYFRLTLETGAAGGLSVNRPVLRGTLPEADPARLSTRILGRTPITEAALADVSGDAADLADLTGEGWRMVTAVFEDPNDTMPTFEIAETLAANGVRIAAKVVFPDLTLTVTLRAVELFERPVCN